ncbi:MAG: FprA family A-type flavoprotein [Candidatus Bipolaricaulota bacterium]
MSTRQIAPGIYSVGVNDRETDLFEGMWPLPNGVSYNAYLVVGERVALIDTVKRPFVDELVANVSQVIDPRRLDFLVANHLEPDHAGGLATLHRLAPQAEIIVTPRGRSILEHMHGVTERVREVSNGENVDLGGKELSFHHIPFVHWPETMATYETTHGVLFSADAFGGFGALDGVLGDDQVNVSTYQDEILRYFSNIVGMHSRPVLRAIDALAELTVNQIAPAHGLIWRENPRRVIDLYARWARMEGEPEVTLVYGSMYGRTRLAAEAAAQGVADEHVPVKIIDASRTHASYIVRDVWKRRGVILAAPTYDAGVFPPLDHALNLLERKRLRNRAAGLLGSYGWQGGALTKLEQRVRALGWELVDVHGYPGQPSEQDMDAARQVGRQVARGAAA